MSDFDVVLVGAGGIGHPCAIALAASKLPLRLAIVDEDEVDETNLHRQILFEESDLGRSKVLAMRDAIAKRAPHMRVEAIEGRALPENVEALVRRAKVVVDATDNFASRFLIADACFLSSIPVVHAAAIRWNATVLAVSPRGAPCYRCLFEDVPRGPALDCATGGILGPVCGVSGAVAADRALAILRGETSVFGALVAFDGWRDRLRVSNIPARRDCALCSDARTIQTIDEARYTEPSCEGEEYGIDRSHP